MPEGKLWFTEFKAKVADGTLCDSTTGRSDICVDGACYKVGCDHQLGSEKVLDECGICNGNGLTCELSLDDHIIEKSGVIFTIPQASTNVYINSTSFAITDNLFLRSKKFGEILFDKRKEQSALRGYKRSRLLNTVVWYEAEDNLEILYIKGPISEAIDVHVDVKKVGGKLYISKYSPIAKENFKWITVVSSCRWQM